MSKNPEVSSANTSPEEGSEVLEPRDPFQFSDEAKSLVEQACAYFTNDFAELSAAIVADDVAVVKVFAPLLTRGDQYILVSTLSEALDDMKDELFLELIKSLQVQSKLAKLLDRELQAA